MNGIIVIDLKQKILSYIIIFVVLLILIAV